MKRLMLSLVGPLRMRPVFEDWLIEQQDENFLQCQLDLPFLTDRLSKWTSSNLSDASVERLGRRPHVTIVYGLDKRDSARIQEIAQDYGRPIRASLGAFNFFDAPDHDVLYIEIISEGLMQLHRDLKALPHTRPSSHPNYTPHLTVAYLKKGVASKFKGTTPFHSVVSRNGISLIDAAGVETFVPTSAQGQEASPILLAAI
jgi:2'-5' RNA ligase